MARAFSRTFRTIHGDSKGILSLVIAIAAVMMAAWLVWFFFANVSVYEVSSSARLEAIRATHPIDAPIPGRVVRTNFSLDDVVAEGDVLLELDAEPQRLLLAEAHAKIESIAPQLTATRGEWAAEKQALAAFRNQGQATLDEAANQMEESRIAAALARDEHERTDRLQKSGSVPEVDAIRAKADAERKAATTAALRSKRSKLKREWVTGQSDRSTRIAALQVDVARLESELGQLHAQVASLEHEIERRKIRAPERGRIGEISRVRAGAFVDEGDRIATIVARGNLRVVGEFTPAATFGRIRTGQAARIRFDGFPWTGDTQATVADVAREIRDGQARVELSIVTPNEFVPMQHGLTGSVEVEVEHTTPANLVLRTVGQVLHRHGAQTPAAPTDDRRERVTSK